MPLEKVKLGESDLYVSPLCLGVMVYGTQVPEEEAHKILDAAFANGINFFDSAEVYPPFAKDLSGTSSKILGSWLKKSGIKREDVVIATKVCGHEPKETHGHIVANRTDPPSEPGDCRLDATSIKAAVDGELRRLGVDYIDIMQTHWPDRYRPTTSTAHYDPSKERDAVPFEEQIQAMADLIKEGKIRYWGVSNETPFGVMSLCTVAEKLNCPKPVTIQNCFSLLSRSFEEGLAEICCKRNFNIPLLPWSPLAGGLLTGKYLGGQRPEGSRVTIMGAVYERYLSDRVWSAAEAYAKIAGDYDLTPVELALLFCKSRFFIGSTIIGATSVKQLETNIATYEKDLPEEALNAINKVHATNPNPLVLYQ